MLQQFISLQYLYIYNAQIMQYYASYYNIKHIVQM